MEFIVDVKSDGMRLDAYLAKVVEDFSRSALKKAIIDSSVKVNSVVASKANYKVSEGDIVFIELDTVSKVIEPRNVDFEILFEDGDVLVINKPAHLVVHPTEANVNDVTTLVHGLIYYLGDSISKVGNEFRPGIVHRLDRDTSGVMVIAKTGRAYLNLTKQFSERRVKKVYETLIFGHLEHKEATIDAPIVRSSNYKKMLVQAGHHSKDSVTHYKVLEEFEDSSLVEVRIETGRTHQIRVHFNSLGHPVIGDHLYGNEKANKSYAKEYGLDRQFLHAKSLKFYHPINKKELLFEAPLGNDLKSALDQL